MVSQNRLRSKLLVINRMVEQGVSVSAIGVQLGSSRQAVQWLLRNHPNINWKVLEYVEKMQSDEDVGRKFKKELDEIKLLLENLP